MIAPLQPITPTFVIVAGKLWKGRKANSSFDNIPLTALALKQGGYDWGFLAYAVGFGGSIIWFGSSAGVALSNLFPEAKSVALWLKHSWYIAVAYVIGFFVLLLVHGWHPSERHKPQLEMRVSQGPMVSDIIVGAMHSDEVL